MILSSIATYATSVATPTVKLIVSSSSTSLNKQVSLSWSSINAGSCVASGDWSGTRTTSGQFTTPGLFHTSTFTLTCSGITGTTGSASQSVTVAVAPSSTQAGSRLGINLNQITDYGDLELTFIDIMKQARGFAQTSHGWDPVNYPVPLDSNGWPTTDCGVWFSTLVPDPLGRPLTTLYPSFFGTYTLSFTGQATLWSTNLVQNQRYNTATNTTTANIVVRPTDTNIYLSFTNTINGVKNVSLLRPGYTANTAQVFTNQFLNALGPFSTLRFKDFLATDANPVTAWSERTLPTNPTQQGINGVAWEYVIALANLTKKDIWINIPSQVNLNDPTANNYVTKLATLLKNGLNPGIHVYVEYSNELWNYVFPQTTSNLNAAINDVNTGADPTLNFDNINNPGYWASRRVVHQIEKISSLFAQVYGAKAINSTIFPVYMSQYVQPFFAEDGLNYLRMNFGEPKNYIYAIGSAPYFYTPLAVTDINSLFASLLSGLNQTLSGGFINTPAFSGSYPVYSGFDHQTLANYYGLKNVSYEGGPDLSGLTDAVLKETSNSDIRINQLVQAELADAFGCGNSLFMYFKIAGSAGDVWASYEDITVPTQKSMALATVAATPLTHYTTCTTSNNSQLYIQ